MWKDISDGVKFLTIAANTKNEALWAVSRKRHQSGAGYQIFSYSDGEWIEDKSQPKGAGYNTDGIAVDPLGNPAFAAYDPAFNSPRHIHYKLASNWMEMKVCTYGVAFGSDGTLYRQDCNYVLHQYYLERREWVQLGTKKVQKFAAGENGLWIIE